MWTLAICIKKDLVLAGGTMHDSVFVEESPLVTVKDGPIYKCLQATFPQTLHSGPL